MPLVMMSGFPCAGKSYRAKQLAEYFTSKIEEAAKEAGVPSSGADVDHNPSPFPPNSALTEAERRRKAAIGKMKVHVVSDETLGVKRTVYGVVKDEKNARAAEMSAVKRLLGRDSIVIADGMNYIKGFRYQMYCEAKALGTPSCVIYVGSPADTCRERNMSRLESSDESEREAGYPSEIFENLVFRYEEPNGMTRWDSPLFVVVPDDEKPELEKIWDGIVGSEGNVKTIKPNMATVLAPTTPQDALQALHTQTTAVITAIQAFQADRPDGGSLGQDVPILGSSTPVSLPNRPVLAAELQRLRRTYVQLRRKGGLVLGGGEKDCKVGQVGGGEVRREDGEEEETKGASEENVSEGGKGKVAAHRKETGYLRGFVDYLNDEFEHTAGGARYV